MYLVYSKDVRLPIQLQRAMAAEAEATREARAKVSQRFHLSTTNVSILYQCALYNYAPGIMQGAAFVKMFISLRTTNISSLKSD